MKRNVVNSPRLEELVKHRRRVFGGKILIYLFAAVAIFGLSAYVSRSSVMNIREIQVTGNKVVDTEMIKLVVDKTLEGNYLWFFPKTNIMFYPKNDIKMELGVQLERLKDINLAIKNSKILEIAVTEREGVYTWCGTTPPDTNVDEKIQCYFLDKDGYIFDEAPYFSGDVYFKFYGAIDMQDGTPPGSNFSPENFSKWISFKESLEKMDLNPVSLYAEENGDVRIFLSGKTRLGEPYIIFKTNDDFQKLIENLDAALSTEPLLSNFKKKYSSLVYIDLRYGNKVYYRFR